MTATHLLFFVACMAAIGVAMWRGGRDERLAAAGLLVAALLSPVVSEHGYASPEVGVVLVDLLVFAGLMSIALRSAAFWPMWAAGFQLCALAVHLAAAQMPHMMPAAYAETLVIWSYPVLAALGFGTWFETGKHRGQS